MKVVINDRTEEATLKLRQYATERLGKLGHHFDRVTEAEVQFSHESHRGDEPESAVRITVHMDGRKHPVLKAEERGRDLRAALDLAFDKVDRQVTKLKEKQRVEAHRAKGIVEALEGAPPTAPSRRNGFEGAPPRVRQKVLAESLDQAIAALDLHGHNFHLFLDEESGEMNVIYRRGEDGFGIIEPDIR